MNRFRVFPVFVILAFLIVAGAGYPLFFSPVLAQTPETDMLIWMHSQLPADTHIAAHAEYRPPGETEWQPITDYLQPFKTRVNYDARQIYWRKDSLLESFYGEIFTYDDHYIYLHAETFPHWPDDPPGHWDARPDRFRLFVNRTVANLDYRIGRVIASRTINPVWYFSQHFNTYLCDSFNELGNKSCRLYQDNFFDDSVSIEVIANFNTVFDGEHPDWRADNEFKNFDQAVVVIQSMNNQDGRERFFFAMKDGIYYGLVRWDEAHMVNDQWFVTYRTTGLKTRQDSRFSFEQMYQRAASDPFLSPSRPLGLRASCPYPGSTLIFHWNSTPGASQYDIRINDLIDGWTPSNLSPNDADINGITETSFIHTSAVAGHQYDWWLHATNIAGQSPPTGGGIVSCMNTQLYLPFITP